MFVGSVDLGDTNFQLVVVPLKGTRLPGQWDMDTDLLMLCHMQSGRCCACRADDHPNRFVDKLGMFDLDAKNLAKWLKENFAG